MNPFRSRSLRSQLLLLGLVSALLPLAVLLTVVFATSSDEEVFDDGIDDGRTTVTSESESTSGVAPAVVVAAALSAVAAVVAVSFWSRRAVAPMETITSVANQIQAGSLDRRIALHGQAREVQALGDSFDEMLDRLSQSSSTQHRLIEDTSHELRTPLAALAANNEVILANPDPSAEDYRTSAERNEALIARMQLTIDELLVGARASAQSTRQVDNDLMAIVQRVAEQHRTVNPAVPLDVVGPPTLRLGIDGPSVERALVNLLENAARFSPPGVPVEVMVLAAADPELSVTDHGPGIAPDALDHVFDRYYRSDDKGGTGIGLALVKQVAEAHGSIDVESPLAGTGAGTRFTIRFARSPRG